MKKRFSVMCLLLALCMTILAGCQSNTLNNETDGNEKKYSIVCTTFPQYDWIRQIIGENNECFELTFLLEKGGDLHSFHPTAQDIARISSADMFVYVGGESDTWVKETLRGAVNESMIKINLMEMLGEAVKTEELVEGMQKDDERGHEHAEETEYDEHIWLSLKNVILLTHVLSENIQQLDTQNASYYVSNEEKYISSLSALDKEYADAISGAKVKTLLFGDRFPFRYMTDDYGISYYAAFAGCSTETDATFETITFLAGKIDELGLGTILVIEGTDQKLAEIIRQNTRDKNQEILTVNSMQSVTSTDIDNGFTYLKAMQENLEILKRAMN